MAQFDQNLHHPPITPPAYLYPSHKTNPLSLPPHSHNVSKPNEWAHHLCPPYINLLSCTRQSLRRAAVRSALSASRAVSVKTTSAPFAFSIVRAAAVSRAVPVQAVRWYSQEPTSQDPLSQDVTEEAHEAEESITEQTQEERQPRRQLDSKSAPCTRDII